MASVVYKSAKQKFISTGLDLTSLTVKAVLVDTADYTFSAAHDFLDDVPSGARVGTPQTLGTKSVTDGVFDAADIAFPSVTGDQCEAIVIYIDRAGAESANELIAYIDTFASGMPVTPNGGNINVAWDNGANRIFAL